MTRIYGQAVLRQIAEACEADPTRETCGFVVRKGGAVQIVCGRSPRARVWCDVTRAVTA